ncbi:hypothetical protein AWI87_14960, partial [Listeria monocytogenes]
MGVLKSEWNRAKRLCIGGAFFVGVGSNEKMYEPEQGGNKIPTRLKEDIATIKKNDPVKKMFFVHFLTNPGL